MRKSCKSNINHLIYHTNIALPIRFVVFKQYLYSFMLQKKTFQVLSSVYQGHVMRSFSRPQKIIAVKVQSFWSQAYMTSKKSPIFRIASHVRIFVKFFSYLISTKNLQILFSRTYLTFLVLFNSSRCLSIIPRFMLFSAHFTDLTALLDLKFAQNSSAKIRSGRI